MHITLCFYKGRAWYDWIERVFCREPMQPLADVPDHCAIILPSPRGAADCAWEAVVSGVHARTEAYARQTVWRTVDLNITPEQAIHLWQFLRAQNHKPYSWRQIWIDAFATFFPAWAARRRIKMLDDKSWDCSALVTGRTPGVSKSRFNKR